MNDKHQWEKHQWIMSAVVVGCVTVILIVSGAVSRETNLVELIIVVTVVCAMGFLAGVQRKDRRQSDPIIRIRLRSANAEVLDELASRIVDTAKRSGATVDGPIPVEDSARDQGEVLTKECHIDIRQARPETVDALKELHMPPGEVVELAILLPKDDNDDTVEPE